jgi:hypothetical protein
MLHAKREAFGIAQCALSLRHLLNHRFGIISALRDDCESALISRDEIHAARVNHVAFVVGKQGSAAPFFLLADALLDGAD